MVLIVVKFQSFITCGWGVSHVGFVLTINGMASLLANIFIAVIVKYIGQGPLIAIGTTILTGVFLTTLTWVPNPNEQYIFYILAALVGFGESSISLTVNGKVYNLIAPIH